MRLISKLVLCYVIAFRSVFSRLLWARVMYSMVPSIISMHNNTPDGVEFSGGISQVSPQFHRNLVNGISWLVDNFLRALGML